jgi:uncharacterized protein YkwD
MARYLVVVGFVVALLGAAWAVHPDAKGAPAVTNCTVSDATIDTEEAELLRILNDYRVSHGVRPLKLSANLNRTATWMATDMATKNYFSHTDSAGRDTFDRSVQCGYPVPAGENLAAGTVHDHAKDAFEILKNSPAHNANMLIDYYVQVGIARVHNPNSRYKWYWVQEFGTVDDGTTMALPGEASAQSAGKVSLPAGTHLVTWSAPTMSPALALASIHGEVSWVYAWDSDSGDWLRYSPSAPAYVNSLTTLETGRTYWLVAVTPIQVPTSP